MVTRTNPNPPHRVFNRPRDWTDSELVARLRLGDSDAGGEMVRRFGFLVRYLCSGRSAGIMDSDDLEQEAWVRLTANGWEAVCAWEGRCPLSAYLSVVTTRVLRLIREQERKHIERAEPLDAAENVAVPTGLSSEDRAAVRLCMRKLPECQRLAISLRFFDALSHSDIAGLLGISVGTSRKRVFDGLRRLERLLGDSYPHLLATYGVSS
ncbi:MAG: sigma-70 family RNA polymerase sigma factor [Fimbriimonadia bacterium]